jgi:hypothetical protein
MRMPQPQVYLRYVERLMVKSICGYDIFLKYTQFFREKIFESNSHGLFGDGYKCVRENE